MNKCSFHYNQLISACQNVKNVGFFLEKHNLGNHIFSNFGENKIYPQKRRFPEPGKRESKLP